MILIEILQGLLGLAMLATDNTIDPLKTYLTNKYKDLKRNVSTSLVTIEFYVAKGRARYLGTSQDWYSLTMENMRWIAIAHARAHKKSGSITDYQTISVRQAAEHYYKFKLQYSNSDNTSQRK